MTAIIPTTSKFGPSGSLKSANSVLEHMSEVRPRIMSEYFFDTKNMFVGILLLTRGEGKSYDPAILDGNLLIETTFLFSRDSYNKHGQRANVQHLFSTIIKGPYPKVIP